MVFRKAVPVNFRPLPGFAVPAQSFADVHRAATLAPGLVFWVNVGDGCAMSLAAGNGPSDQGAARGEV